MQKTLVIKGEDEIIISFNGTRLIIPMSEKYQNLTEDEIAKDFLVNRNVKK